MKNYATFNDLEDTSVFITGGGSGIGAPIPEPPPVIKTEVSSKSLKVA